MTALLIIAIRLLVPLTILRWPFWGALAAMAADASDVIIRDALGASGEGLFGWPNYHSADKIFDIYYLALLAYVSLKWQDVLARRTSAVLFLWRLAGFIAFEITRLRQIMFFAPNIFENFYLLVAGAKTFSPAFRIDRRGKLALFLLAAAVPKLIQEYIMHYLEFPTWLFQGRLEWKGPGIGETVLFRGDPWGIAPSRAQCPLLFLRNFPM